MTNPSDQMTTSSPSLKASSSQEPSVSPVNQNSEPKDVVLSVGQQKFVFLMLSLLVVVMLIHWARLQGWGLEPVEVLRPDEHKYDYKIEINSATWVEWIQLEGIGKPTAAKILKDRTENGPFTSIDDLQRVNGIGAKKLAKLRPWLIMSDSASDQ